MPLQIPPEQLETIVRSVGSFPAGASVGQLMELPGIDLPRRTLQRRLERLVETGRIVARGEGRGRHYLLPNTTPLVEEPETPYNSRAAWLSPEAKEIRALVKRPIQERKPVGYHSEFLADYEPNVTNYIDDKTRRTLAGLGEVGICNLPAGTYLRHVLTRLLIDLSWNSSRLEGNTYSLLETERLLEHGEDAAGKGTKNSQMILNHKAAIEMLADQAGEIGFNRYTVCNLHALLADNLMTDQSACGQVRSRPVGISGTVFLPLEVPQQLEERFDEILMKAEAIDDPFEQAFFCMVHLPYLQPFEDVNKRVSRLAANIPLVKKNLCPLSFTDVPQDDYLSALIGIYELNRIEYMRDLFVWAYGRSAERYSAIRGSLGDPDPFRLKHRTTIKTVVREIVQGTMDQSTAEQHVATAASRHISPADHKRFREVIDVELNSLHEGNIVRYRLRPTEFEAWKKVCSRNST